MYVVEKRDALLLGRVIDEARKTAEILTGVIRQIYPKTNMEFSIQQIENNLLCYANIFLSKGLDSVVIDLDIWNAIKDIDNYVVQLGELYERYRWRLYRYHKDYAQIVDSIIEMLEDNMKWCLSRLLILDEIYGMRNKTGN